MTINCNNIDDLLLEGDPRAMELAAQHARHCVECAEKLAGWNDIGETAQALQADWRSDMLWPRIQRALAAEKRKRIITTTWRVAAAAVLTISLGAGSWFAARHSREAAFDFRIIRVSALDEVERAEQAHLAAIDHLEKVADTKIEQNSALMVSYKEKLMLLDDAIAECQTNIDRNRQNAHLRKQLLAIYTEKQRTLEQVMWEGNHVSNQ